MSDERLTAAMDRLDALREQLRASCDPRAEAALALLSAAEPDLDALAEVGDQAAPAAWREAAALAAPDVDEIERACTALRLAAVVRTDEQRRGDVLGADRVQFLETSLEFRDRHGPQPCPVCAEGVLDDAWVKRARAALAAEQQAAGALRAARSGAHRARQTLAGLVRAVAAPPAGDLGLSTAAAARVAHQGFSTIPFDDDSAVADHVERTLPELVTAYAALRQEAVETLATSEDAWRPVAAELSKWVTERRGSGSAPDAPAS
jgi:hypothetical protein